MLGPFLIWNNATQQFESHSALFDGAENVSFTPASDASDLTKMTFVADIKITDIPHYGGIFGVGGSDGILIYQSKIYFMLAGGASANLFGVELFDDSAHYGQLYVGIDTTQVTPSDRIVIKWNNVPLTLSGSYPAQNYSLVGFCKALAHYLGMGNGANYGKFYCSEMAFLPGVIESSDSFYDSDTNSMKDLTALNPEHWLRFQSFDLVPVMTSNTTPSGTASATTEYSGTYAAWKAFNGVVSGSSNNWSTSIGNTTGTLTYDFEKDITLKSYAIVGGGDDGADASPNTWTVEVYDGVSWNVSDTVSGETGWGDGERRHFTVDTELTGSQVRLVVTANDGDANFLNVREFDPLSDTLDGLGANSGSEGDWTVNGDVEHTSDSPENNVCTLEHATGGTGLSDGNRLITDNGVMMNSVFALPVGKWIAGVKIINGGGSRHCIGLRDADKVSATAGSMATFKAWFIDGYDGALWAKGVLSASGHYTGTLPLPANTLEMIAVEVKANGDADVWWWIDGSWVQGDPATGASPSFADITPTGGEWFIGHATGSNTDDNQYYFAFDHMPSAMQAAVPEGFLTLEGKNDATFNTPATVS